jgi:hypothetical protein
MIAHKRATRFGVSLMTLCLAVGLAAATTGCKKKTPAEKFGDKIEDVGDNLEEGAKGH